MKTLDFYNPHGQIGTLILEPGKPPAYYWAGRVDCPAPVKDALTKGLTDPESGKRISGGGGQEFLETLAFEYARGDFLRARTGKPITDLPKGARKLDYTPGVAEWWS